MNDRYRDAIIGIAAIFAASATVAMLLAFGSLREYAGARWISRSDSIGQAPATASGHP